MMFKSTRGYSEEYSFSDAVLTGIAPDGGLFVPVEFPQYTENELASFCNMNYCEMALEIFSKYATYFRKTSCKIVIFITLKILYLRYLNN